MSDIILPGDIDVRGGVSKEQLEAAAQAQERAELQAELKGRLSPFKPYRDDAPVCDTAWWQNTEGVATKYHGGIQAPVWSHGRCIGPACVRFVKGLNVCGRLVQDYAAAAQLGLLDARSAREAVQEAALPPEDRDAR